MTFVEHFKENSKTYYAILLIVVIYLLNFGLAVFFLRKAKLTGKAFQSTLKTPTEYASINAFLYILIGSIAIAISIVSASSASYGLRVLF
jgi:hypothetical protein